MMTTKTATMKRTMTSMTMPNDDNDDNIDDNDNGFFPLKNNNQPMYSLNSST
jgi:hypothetical protein